MAAARAAELQTLADTLSIGDGSLSCCYYGGSFHPCTGGAIPVLSPTDGEP